MTQQPQQPKPASPSTAATNRRAARRHPMRERADFTDVNRGFIADLPEVLVDAHGHVVRDGRMLDYITDDAPCPDSVNPSLWRQSQLIKRAGLFEVVTGCTRSGSART